MSEILQPLNLEAEVKRRENAKRPEVSEKDKERSRAEFESRKIQLIIDAIDQQTHGVSYRIVPIRVGTSILSFNPNVEGGYQAESGHNYTPSKRKRSGWGKFCAESNVCASLIKDGSEYIAGIVVVSNSKELGTDPHDKMHNEHALHSCHNCRNLYREMIKEGVMDNNTIIRFVNDDQLVYLDEKDTETWVNGTDEEPRHIQIPKLKLKKQPLTEKDIENLPYEETTIGEFLNRKEYLADEPSLPGDVPHPYPWKKAS